MSYITIECQHITSPFHLRYLDKQLGARGNKQKKLRHSLSGLRLFLLCHHTGPPNKRDATLRPTSGGQQSRMTCERYGHESVLLHGLRDTSKRPPKRETSNSGKGHCFRRRLAQMISDVHSGGQGPQTSKKSLAQKIPTLGNPTKENTQTPWCCIPSNPWCLAENQMNAGKGSHPHQPQVVPSAISYF